MTLLAAILTITVDMIGLRPATYILKPVTILLIMAIVLAAREHPSARYQRTLLVGLILSLLGDILLALPQDLFIFGLVSFLLAQICYIYAFSSVQGFDRSPARALPFLIIGILLAAILWVDLGEMRIPALIYMVVILIMAWQAMGFWRLTGDKRAFLAFAGAVLFVISDLSLAVNRFVSPFEWSSILVLGTYYPAQWLIGLSAGEDHP